MRQIPPISEKIDDFIALPSLLSLPRRIALWFPIPGRIPGHPASQESSSSCLLATLPDSRTGSPAEIVESRFLLPSWRQYERRSGKRAGARQITAEAKTISALMGH